MDATTKQILKFLVDRGYGYSSEIRKRTGLSREAVSTALRELRQNGLVRMKEDSIDHDWEYRPTDKAKEVVKYPADPDEVSGQMDEEVLKEGAPMVGIFWIHDGEVIPPNGIGCSATIRDAPEVAGYCDSPADHIGAWPLVTKLYPELRGKEYDEVPRGRVTMHKGSGQFLAMLPPEVVDDVDVRRKIANEFNLPKNNTKFIGDDHYRLSMDDADWDDDNF